MNQYSSIYVKFYSRTSSAVVIESENWFPGCGKVVTPRGTGNVLGVMEMFYILKKYMYICYKSNELYTYIAYVLLCLNYTPVKTVL